MTFDEALAALVEAEAELKLVDDELVKLNERLREKRDLVSVKSNQFNQALKERKQNLQVMLDATTIKLGS